MKKNLWKKRAKRALRRPSLRFSPYAWGKLLYLRDRGETEIGGFGLSAADDPLLIHDILTVKQQHDGHDRRLRRRGRGRSVRRTGRSGSQAGAIRAGLDSYASRELSAAEFGRRSDVSPRLRSDRLVGHGDRRPQRRELCPACRFMSGRAALWRFRCGSTTGNRSPGPTSPLGNRSTSPTWSSPTRR